MRFNLYFWYGTGQNYFFIQLPYVSQLLYGIKEISLTKYTHGKKLGIPFIFVLTKYSKNSNFRSLVILIFMAYFSKHHLDLSPHDFVFGLRYNLPRVNNAKFHENKIAPLFLYTTENNLVKQNSVE